jgi:Kdo2-lipid IVA lauroyltransferase/acyltransferase
MKKRNPLAIWAEAAAVALAVPVISRLSRGAVVRLANGLGNSAYRLSRRDRRIALANVDLAFGSSRGAAEKEAIVRGSFRTMALVLLDLLWFQRRTAERVKTWVSFDESYYRHYKAGEPSVVVTAHYGNWEAMGLAGGLAGAPCHSVAMPLKNPIVDKLLLQARRVTGQLVIPRQGAIKALIRALREGGTAAFLNDQNTLPEEGGRFVDFFGLPVPVSDAAEMLARRANARVFFMCTVVDEAGRYRIESEPPILPDSSAAAGDAAITQRTTQFLEGRIRSRPELWLWMYKRWKYVPPGADAAKYPFYARAISAERAEGKTSGNR